VFSPYYYWSGRADPLNHCSLNVALYGAGGHRWTMTERGRGSVSRTDDAFAIGPSALSWDGTALTIAVDEVTAPFPTRISGTVKVYPDALTRDEFALDCKGQHKWWPIAPSARIEVELAKPGLRWSGEGYLDTNFGAEPLEARFKYWDWSRAPVRDGAYVLYDVTEIDGQRNSLALSIDNAGSVTKMEQPQDVRLPRTMWGVPRSTQAEGGDARVVKTLENAPFYARSILQSRLKGELVASMHESLSLDRFKLPIVKMMLPFRMPRIGR
jgi:carotenoid 1,2-hydratase